MFLSTPNIKYLFVKFSLYNFFFFLTWCINLIEDILAQIPEFFSILPAISRSENVLAIL